MFKRIRFGSRVLERQRRLVQLKPVLGLVQNFMDVVQARLGDGFLLVFDMISLKLLNTNFWVPVCLMQCRLSKILSNIFFQTELFGFVLPGGVKKTYDFNAARA